MGGAYTSDLGDKIHDGPITLRGHVARRIQCIGLGNMEFEVSLSWQGRNVHWAIGSVGGEPREEDGPGERFGRAQRT